MPIVDFHIHDVLRLRKPHPCGGYEWQVYRLGADIGLRCQTCGHRVLLSRPVLEKRLKKFISRGPDIPLPLFFPNLAADDPGLEMGPRTEVLVGNRGDAADHGANSTAQSLVSEQSRSPEDA